jgi:hypothetical protein
MVISNLVLLSFFFFWWKMNGSDGFEENKRLFWKEKLGSPN